MGKSGKAMLIYKYVLGVVVTVAEIWFFFLLQPRVKQKQYKNEDILATAKRYSTIISKSSLVFFSLVVKIFILLTLSLKMANTIDVYVNYRYIFSVNLQNTYKNSLCNVISTWAHTGTELIDVAADATAVHTREALLLSVLAKHDQKQTFLRCRWRRRRLLFSIISSHRCQPHGHQ